MIFFSVFFFFLLGGLMEYLEMLSVLMQFTGFLACSIIRQTKTATYLSLFPQESHDCPCPERTWYIKEVLYPFKSPSILVSKSDYFLPVSYLAVITEKWTVNLISKRNILNNFFSFFFFNVFSIMKTTCLFHNIFGFLI